MPDHRAASDEFKQVTVVVTFKYRHRDVTKSTLREYMKDALHTWGGQFDPGEFTDDEDAREPDPLFYGLRNIQIGKIHDGDPESVLVLLQADQPKTMGTGKVRGKRGRRRSTTSPSVPLER